MRSKYRKALSFLAVVLLVTSVLPPGMGGASQTAEAQPLFGSDESKLDVCEGVTSINPAMFVVEYFSGTCDEQYGNLDGRTPDELHYDAHVDAITAEDRRTRQVVEGESYINTTTAIANQESKYWAISELNNESQKAAALGTVNQKVNDWFATNKKSMAAEQAAQARHAADIAQRIEDTDGLQTKNLFSNGVGYSDDGDAGNTHYKEIRHNQTNITLSNGDTMTVTVVVGNLSYPNYGSASGSYMGQGHGWVYLTDYGNLLQDVDNSALFPGVENDSTTWGAEGNTYEQLYVSNPQGDAAELLNGEEWGDAIRLTEDHRSTSLSNAEQITSDIFANYEPGELDLQSEMSPAAKFRTGAMEYGGTGGTLFPLMVAQDMGYKTSQSAHEYSLEYTPASGNETTSISGNVYVTGEHPFPSTNSTMKTGATYNTTTWNRTQLHVLSTDQNGNVQDKTLSGTVYVNQITLPDGTVVNSTKIQSSGYETTNADDMQQQINDDAQARENITSNVTTNVTIFGGDLGNLGDGGLPSTNVLVGGIVLLIALLVAITSLIDAIKPF